MLCYTEKYFNRKKKSSGFAISRHFGEVERGYHE
jgi:hypothetical protein